MKDRLDGIETLDGFFNAFVIGPELTMLSMARKQRVGIGALSRA